MREKLYQNCTKYFNCFLFVMMVHFLILILHKLSESAIDIPHARGEGIGKN